MRAYSYEQVGAQFALYANPALQVKAPLAMSFNPFKAERSTS